MPYQEDRIPSDANTSYVALCALFLCMALVFFGVAIVSMPDNSTMQIAHQRSTLSSELARTVYISDEDGSKHGSGYLYGKGKVLTAAHVATMVDDGGKLYVQRCSDPAKCDRVEAKLLWVSKAYDIAVLQTSYGAVGPLLPRCEAELQVGDLLRWSGFPAGFERPSMSYGWVSRVEGNDVGPLTLWHDTAVVSSAFIQGNSGGPVFAENGSFVGIVVGTQLPRPIGYLVPARVICNLFGKN